MCAQLERQRSEAPLDRVELGQICGGHLRRRHSGGEPLELGADEERLAQLVRRDRAHAHAAVRLERDETERGEAAKRLAHRRAADVEPLGRRLLAADGPRPDHATHDPVPAHARGVVGLETLPGTGDPVRQQERLRVRVCEPGVQQPAH